MSTVICKFCKTNIEVPPSRIWRTHFCSNACRSQHKSVLLKTRSKTCKVCQTLFTPRKQQLDAGHGIYCSNSCKNSVKPKMCNAESRAKALQTYLNNLRQGLIKHKTGIDHPRWKGGDIAARERRVKDGRSKQSIAKYRKLNPEKTKLWALKRRLLMGKTIPVKYIKDKLQQQNYLCVYCKTNIFTKYHRDHIVPLALGGKNEISNIQMLCQSCNSKKWIKLNFSLHNSATN